MSFSTNLFLRWPIMVSVPGVRHPQSELKRCNGTVPNLLESQLESLCSARRFTYRASKFTANSDDEIGISVKTERP